MAMAMAMVMVHGDGCGDGLLICDEGFELKAALNAAFTGADEISKTSPAAITTAITMNYHHHHHHRHRHRHDTHHHMTRVYLHLLISKNAMSCLITVGTTQFNALIQAIDEAADTILDILISRQISRLIVQLGTGSYWPSKLEECADKHPSIVVECVRFHNDFADILAAATLIIGHAGAGTILEALRAHRQLLVVINDSLMDNHQLELAQELAKDSYLDYCSVKDIVKSLRLMEHRSFAVFPEANAREFRRILHEDMMFE